MWENTLPIHRNMYEIARTQIYEIALEINILNPDCEIADIKTDCLAYNNVMTSPHTSTAWGHIKNVMYQ